jgi:hypothetical protein
VAEHEREMISQRTKAALHAASILPIIRVLQAEGITRAGRAIAVEWYA